MRHVSPPRPGFLAFFRGYAALVRCRLLLRTGEFSSHSPAFRGRQVLGVLRAPLVKAPRPLPRRHKRQGGGGRPQDHGLATGKIEPGPERLPAHPTSLAPTTRHDLASVRG